MLNTLWNLRKDQSVLFALHLVFKRVCVCVCVCVSLSVFAHMYYLFVSCVSLVSKLIFAVEECFSVWCTGTNQESLGDHKTKTLVSKTRKFLSSKSIFFQVGIGIFQGSCLPNTDAECSSMGCARQTGQRTREKRRTEHESPPYFHRVQSSFSSIEPNPKSRGLHTLLNTAY